jgi:hypothetical protein
MITKADKGNSIVILYIDDYNRKIYNFITNNSFTLATRYITNKKKKELLCLIVNLYVINYVLQRDSKRWTQIRTSIFPELYMVCE